MAILTTNPIRTTYGMLEELPGEIKRAFPEGDPNRDKVSSIIKELVPHLPKLPLTYQSFDLLKRRVEESLPFVKEVKGRVLGAMDRVFQDVKWDHILTKQEDEQLMALFNDRAEWSLAIENGDCLGGNYEVYDVRNLEIDLTFDEIQDIYQKHGVIQLKKIDPNASTLILGCGNRRMENDGGYSIPFQNLYPQDDEDNYAYAYPLKHIHPDAVTIDIEAANNPTIVADLNEQSVFRLFKGQKFTTIIYEGYFNPERDLPLRGELLAELLEDGGELKATFTDFTDDERAMLKREIEAYKELRRR